MARESNRISSAFYETIKKGKATPGVYRDGSGLVLHVEESGAARWVLRVVVKGRRKDIGLGSASETTRLVRCSAPLIQTNLAMPRRASSGLRIVR